MFGTYYYHRLIRKYITLFGSIFDNITVKRMDADFTNEIERLRVPINWAAKEKYIQKLALQSETPEVQTVLPRMSFELIGLTYDASRKTVNSQRYATMNTANNALAYSSFSEAPYNIQFRLNIHARNLEDIGQIIEQIIPYFQPDFTPTVDLLQYLRIPKDVKLILNTIEPFFGFEGPLGVATRDITASLTFTMQAYFFGVVSSDKLITKVIVNEWIEGDNIIVVNLGNGSGIFAVDDTVFQGNNSSYATAVGHVRYFYNFANTSPKQLEIAVKAGVFVANSNIKSISSNTNWEMTSIAVNRNDLVATFTVTPSPLTAMPNSEFGIDITIDPYDYELGP